MADIELVIKLSEEDYTEICKCAYPNDLLVGELVYQVRNNKPLPKGHGRLVDLAIKALKKEQRWTPVSEGLPDTEDEVLCWYEYYHWSKGKVLPEYGIGSYLRETSAWLGEVAVGRDVRVIAWQPLPKPYEPQEGEDKE